jgi:hypothetical protein
MVELVAGSHGGSALRAPIARRIDSDKEAALINRQALGDRIVLPGSGRSFQRTQGKLTVSETLAQRATFLAFCDWAAHPKYMVRRH